MQRKVSSQQVLAFHWQAIQLALSCGASSLQLKYFPVPHMKQRRIEKLSSGFEQKKERFRGCTRI